MRFIQKNKNTKNNYKKLYVIKNLLQSSRHVHQIKQYICQQMIHTLTVAMTITFYTSQY